MPSQKDVYKYTLVNYVEIYLIVPIYRVIFLIFNIQRNNFEYTNFIKFWQNTIPGQMYQSGCKQSNV